MLLSQGYQTFYSLRFRSEGKVVSLVAGHYGLGVPLLFALKTITCSAVIHI